MYNTTEIRCFCYVFRRHINFYCWTMDKEVFFIWCQNYLLISGVAVWYCVAGRLLLEQHDVRR